MKTMWKTVVIAAAVAGLQFIGMGLPKEASALSLSPVVKSTQCVNPATGLLGPCSTGTSPVYTAVGAVAGGTGNLPPFVLARFNNQLRLMSVGTVHAAADIPVDLGDVIEFDGITQGDFNDFLGLGLSLASQAELDAYLIDFPNTQTFTRDLTIHPTWDASNAGSTQDVLFELPAAVPEPSTVLLLGSGLAGLVAFRIRRRRVSASQ